MYGEVFANAESGNLWKGWYREIDSDFQSGGGFASMGKKVIQIGCDPKADSTINLLGMENHFARL